MQAKGWHSRGYLPHFDAAGLVQAITFRLADSLPQALLDRLPTDDDPARARALEAALDRGLGSCALGQPAVAGLLEDALLHLDRERYRLLCWCVMPNHVHVLIQTVPGHTVSAVVHSWKSFTANRARAIVPGEGRFWQPDYYDRYIRDDRHFTAARTYIEANPVKAGLCAAATDWPHSSARHR